MSKRRSFSLLDGAVVSLLLHAVLAAPFLLFALHQPQRSVRRVKRLNVELFGMVSNRQAAAAQMRVQSAHAGNPEPQRLKQLEPKPQAEPKRPASAQPLAASNAQASEVPDVVRLPGYSPAFSDLIKTSGGVSQPGGDFQQRQQYLGHRDEMADRLNAYMAQMSRQIEAHKFYPFEARRKRLEGVSRISFVVTESGAIKPQTLAISKSSGYAILDAAAVKAAQNSAPFQKPPRELAVGFDISFDVDF